MSAHQDFARETWHLNAFNMCEVIVIREGADARGHRYIDGRHQVRVHLYENVQAAANAVRQHNRAMTAVSDEAGRDAYLPFDAPLWQQYEHRIKWLMARIGMPDSVSLAEAMKQLLNDAEYIRTNRTPAAALSAAPVAQEPAWRYEIQHGPDGETDWAWVYDAENNLVCTAKTYHAAAIVRASSPPATSAGVGADEIARALANSLGMDLDEEERMAARGHSPSQNYLNEWNKYANAILAFLSRAGVQSNSTQKDGSR